VEAAVLTPLKRETLLGGGCEGSPPWRPSGDFKFASDLFFLCSFCEWW